MSEQKITFSITHYPALQHVKIIIEELYVLLTHNKQNKKLTLHVAKFWHDNSFEDYLVREKLPKLEENGRCEPRD